MELSRKQVYELIIKLGYRWAQGVKRGARIVESPQKRGDTFRFALEWSEMLQMEAAGSHVIVYQDESFVNTGHTHRFSWFLVEHSLLRFRDGGTFNSFSDLCWIEQ